MRLDINLATQPYEDARQFWLHWGTALAVASILTLALLTFTVSDWFAARRDHAQIADLRAQIAQRDRKREQAQEFLNRPENRATRDQSQFLNELIERKSLSWTHVLEDLEKVMPARVHLVSIHPALDEDNQDNQLALKMVVAGDSRERAIELASRMEDSGRFTHTYIETETTAAVGSGDTVQFDINGVYIPETPGAPAATRVAQTKTLKGRKP
jgi:type IV pilus assembly protein PilN